MSGERPVASHVRVVEFDQSHLKFRLPVELLQSSCPSANAAALAAALTGCRKLASERLHGSFVQRVRNVLLEQLRTNPEVEDLALNIGITGRTLARRLADAGLTYSNIKEELRKTQAAWYLQHTELSIEVIASQLGYGDPTNFSRKFRHWYQTTPSQMRKEFQLSLR